MPEVDQYDKDPNNPPSEHQSDMDDNLREEEQKDGTTIQKSPINAPPTLQVPFKYTTMSQMMTAPTIAVQTTMTVTEQHDLIPPTSGSDRREVPGIEATGHFSDT